MTGDWLAGPSLIQVPDQGQASWGKGPRVIDQRALLLIGIGVLNGVRVSHGEGLWTGQLAPPPNGVEGADWGPAAWRRSHGWLASWPCP